MQPGLRVNVAKVIRILSKRAKPTFGETLEEKARQRRNRGAMAMSS